MIKKITLERFLKQTNNTVFLRKDFLEIIDQRLRERYGTQQSISQKIGCSRRYYAQIIKGERNPNTKIVSKICQLSNISPGIVIDKIYPHCNYNHSWIEPDMFPIPLDETIAALIGHTMSDGHVGQTFGYTNTDKALLENVQSLLKKIPVENLSQNSWEHNGTTLRFSTIVRDILLCAGAPKGNKIIQKTGIPLWIRDGSKKIKKSFLRAVFDDEGCVSLKDRTIDLSYSKQIRFEQSLDQILQDLKSMLTDLGIRRISVVFSGFNDGKNSKTISKKIVFYGYYNFINFQEKIGFLHPKKIQRLESHIKSIKIKSKSRNEKRSEFIKQLRAGRAMSAKSLSSKIDMSHKGVLAKLANLEQEDLVFRLKVSYKPYRFLWIAWEAQV